MRVLMFGWEFPPHISGGLGTACSGLANGLSSIDGTKIIFVVPKVYGCEESHLIDLIGAGDIAITKKRISLTKFGQLIDYFEIQSKLVPYLQPDEYATSISQTIENLKLLVETDPEGKLKFTGQYGKDLFTEIARYAVVADVIAQNQKFDVIHAHDWLTFPAGIAAKQRTGKPLIVHVHATDFDRSGGQVNQDVYNIEKKGMMLADKVITVSNLTRKAVIDKYGIHPDKVITVYNAVEPFRYNIRTPVGKRFDDKIVTFLGRITTQKGPCYFVDVAKRILQRMDNVRFVMAGCGDLMEEMIRRVAQLQISDKFHFAGFLKGSDVYRMFRMSDVFVMPSVSEPFGISPLEAMQAGVPVVISRQSGVAEILSHAIKTDFWDIDGMSDAIHGILKYPSLSGMLAKSGKAESGKLNWTDVAFKVNDIYKNLVFK